MEPKLTENNYVITMCEGTTCMKASRELREGLEKEVRRLGLEHRVRILISGCLGMCDKGPILIVNPGYTIYGNVTVADIPAIVGEHIVNNRPVARLAIQEDRLFNRFYRIYGDVNFFGKQMRITLRNCGVIDPESIDEYMSVRGYEALAKALTSMTPAQVVEEVKKSGLRGRGGAGFPTGTKWEFTARSTGMPKYVVCNADEGDPGAFMDRSAIEGDPHTVLEGMIIGGYAIGAEKGFIYIRAEYPLAIERLEIGIAQARREGFLGKNILGTDFSFDIEIRLGAGAFVCGEETALIHSIEGQRGVPTMKPPYPAVQGLFNKPTLLNNVETWANIPVVIIEGAEWFSSLGTATSKGTKVFALAGNVRNTGLVEVPMGTTLRQILYDVGGGIPNNKKFKAAQTGGPSGGCIPPQFLDTPIDYESLAKIGSIMGSGGMIVVDENTCMVNMARYFLEFTQDESCGKCTPCREGTLRMLQILTRICNGQGRMEDLDLLQSIGTTIKQTALCGLGQSAPNPALSTLKYFYDEYIEHIRDKKCRAGVCRELTGAPCQSACPVGTEAWRYIAHIQRGEYDKAYLALREPNPLPSVCARVCNHPCERTCRAGRGDGQSIAIRDLKRFVTDRFDPAAYKPKRTGIVTAESPKVAVIGAGPAGLSAAHNLSLMGYPVTIFEAENKPGGVLVGGIPAYRLPREGLAKEINALIDENVTLKCEKTLGRDFTIDSLMKDGFKSVFVAIGSHKSLRLSIDGEDSAGVYSSMEFLKAFNLHGKELAAGHVGIVGGGNSAPDAARVALRQKGVKSVTIFYRRSRDEMPVFVEEIEAALSEGVNLVTLVSPTRIITRDGKLESVEFCKNELGTADAAGRRKFQTVAGSLHTVRLDTMIVAISEKPDVDCVGGDGVRATDWGTIETDRSTMQTGRPGVFAGGDAATGPSTVVEALAAGAKAAKIIDRYLRGEKLAEPARPSLPSVYVEQDTTRTDIPEKLSRPEAPVLPVAKRAGNLNEVELTISERQAFLESCRCLRCDLEFTMKKKSIEEKHRQAVMEEAA
jgi:NADH-quinone oxidoreductase subunit F